MFMPNWSAKVEYLYTQISGTGNNNNWWVFNPGFGLNSPNNRTRFHTIRAGVNYHFNFGAPAPVLAKY
jgi:outer membrane immunogenic protein